ncbi:sugar phosphate isomerase/epimerase [Oricola sp.]|uniref:sugar phosphate isomerase/epimerase family protein n=1 Tax=Oricola sp. TaxID=1979950 RepID=UPI0025D349D5|nr:sugar phosphate isomerase/epimerase [Oricola sp.]MCI5076489.1 sugar phosphate isomerase/epimerase [Oricola sp.]
MRKFSLAYLTANGAGPVGAVQIAAEAGYDMISFRLLPGGPGDEIPPLMDDDALFRETTAVMRDTGVTMADAEMIRIGPDAEPRSFTPFLDRIAEMGAKHILTAIDDPERDRAIASYGAICELVAGYGLTADVEFMPWTACKTVADALEFVNAVDLPSSAILFDTLHYDRCGSTPEDIAKIPAHKMNYIQLCDGPADYVRSDAEMIRIARTARMFPGAGGIDLGAFLHLMPPDITVSVEVPDKPLAESMGRTAFAREALDRTKAVLDQAQPA